MAVPERDCSIIFSVNSINLHSDIGGPKSRVYTYFVLNKGTSSKRIRVTTSKESDAVSFCMVKKCIIIAVTLTALASYKGYSCGLAQISIERNMGLAKSH